MKKSSRVVDLPDRGSLQVVIRNTNALLIGPDERDLIDRIVIAMDDYEKKLGCDPRATKEEPLLSRWRVRRNQAIHDG